MLISTRSRRRLGTRHKGLRMWADDGISYLLQDLFTTDRAAGAVNGTAAEPIGGLRTVTDTNSKLSIVGGVANFATGGVGAGDPGLWYPSQARVIGKVLLGTITWTSGNGATFGWDNTQAGSIRSSFVIGGTTLTILVSGSGLTVGTLTSGGTYQCALVMTAAGYYYFIKGGVQYPNWSLVGKWGTDSGAMFPGLAPLAGTAEVFVGDNIRVPTNLYIPTPLAYDTFTRANGALGNSETTGPDAQAVTARAWTGATFAVAGNVAVNTPATLGSELIVNGNMELDANWPNLGSPTTNERSSEQAHGGTFSRKFITDATFEGIQQANLNLVAGIWYVASWWVFSSQSVFGSAFNGDGSGNNGVIATGIGAWVNKVITFRNSAAGAFGGLSFLSFADAVTTAYIDDVSLKALTLSELFASLSVSTADVLADVNVTGPTSSSGIQAGMVLNLDSAASPANFILAYLDGQGLAKLVKCVAGVYTQVISAAVTYSAGAVLRVIKSGTSYSLFYNGAAVGSTSTISDAGIINNTLHGLFSTSPLNSLDVFQLFPRGVNNEYSGLDAY